MIEIVEDDLPQGAVIKVVGVGGGGGNAVNTMISAGCARLADIDETLLR